MNYYALPCILESLRSLVNTTTLPLLVYRHVIKTLLYSVHPLHRFKSLLQALLSVYLRRRLTIGFIVTKYQVKHLITNIGEPVHTMGFTNAFSDTVRPMRSMLRFLNFIHKSTMSHSKKSRGRRWLHTNQRRFQNSNNHSVETLN